jgi:hypothetical protein
MQVPHSSIDKLPDLKAALSAQMAAAGGLVTRKGEGLVLGKFTEAGVDLTAQVGAASCQVQPTSAATHPAAAVAHAYASWLWLCQAATQLLRVRQMLCGW